MSGHGLAAEKLQCMQMHVCERLIIRGYGEPPRGLPKTATLGPSRIQMSRLLGRNPINLGRRQLRDRGRNRGCRAENQIGRPRHRATDRPIVHQNLTNERHCPRFRARVRLLSTECLLFAGSRVASNRGAESSSRSGLPDRDLPARMHAHPVGPTGSRWSHRRKFFLSPRVRRNARSTGAPSPGAFIRPTLRHNRWPQDFLFLSHQAITEFNRGRFGKIA